MTEPRDAAPHGDIHDCYDVMAELRPHVKREAFLPTVRAMEPDGFRLAFIREDGRVVAVAGYRVSTHPFYGKHLYVDDLVTTDSLRPTGHGPVLLASLRTLAVPKVRIAFLHDSALPRNRAKDYYLPEWIE